MSDEIKYELIIYWSEDDGSFVVEVPELPGCMADGETYMEVVTNAQTAIWLWIEAARYLGRKIPEPISNHRYHRWAQIRNRSQSNERSCAICEGN